MPRRKNPTDDEMLDFTHTFVDEVAGAMGETLHMIVMARRDAEMIRAEDLRDDLLDRLSEIEDTVYSAREQAKSLRGDIEETLEG